MIKPQTRTDQLFVFISLNNHVDGKKKFTVLIKSQITLAKYFRSKAKVHCIST